MSRIDSLIQRGIAFVKDGNEATARSLFRAIISEEPQNRLAWAWYVQSFSEDDERLQAVEEYLDVFPGDQYASALQASLLKRRHLHWKQVAVSAIREVDQVKREKKQEIKNKNQSLYWAGIAFAVIGLIFACIFCSTSISAANKQSQLSNRINALDSQYSALSQSHQSLQSQYNLLQTNYNVLESTYEDLSARYDTVLGDYNWLKQVSVQPPYILTSGRNIRLVFNKLDGSLLEWEISSDWLEYHLRRGDELRKNMKYSLLLNNKFTDETYAVVDDRDFIDPTPFVNVMTDLYNQSKDEYTFIREVWNVVAQLTAYTYEIQETPRFPMETLLSGGGDCEDHAILFASMILASPPSWDVKLVYMDANNPTKPQAMNHVIVEIITPNVYLIEATSKINMTPYDQGVVGWYYEVEK